jgi:phenylacetate-CoA ligase
VTAERSTYAWLGPRFILPLYERLGGRRFWSECRRLKALQWQTPEELETRAVRKLRALVAHAAAHVPFYRDLYRQAGIRADNLRTVGDLAHVPITRKAELRDHFPDRTMADNLPASRRWRTMTSGSTGFPFEFFTDAASGDGIAAGYLLFLAWAGVGVWHARIDITNFPDRPMPSILPKPPALVRLARGTLLGERVVGLSGVNLAPDAFVTRSRAASRRGYFVRGYPSYLARLASRILEERTWLPARPRVVISVGETLTALDAEAIGRAFGSRVVNQYSAWEVPHMAQTCPDNPRVLHVNSERVILRVLRDDGTPAGPGERGRVVITALDNYVMPFINYDIGDSGVPDAACPCGRGLPTLASVEGRLGEAIRTPRGRIVAATTLDGVFRSAGSFVREYQAVQTAADTITLRIVPTAGFTPEIAAELQRALEKLAGTDVRIRVEPVPRIALEPSGKRLVIKAQRVPPGPPPGPLLA